jgi:hypothetical protein
MPYIREADKVRVHVGGPHTPGELNYAITKLLIEYIEYEGFTTYETLNDIMGALEGAKLEFYRRIAVPYEEAKKAENGDVY